MRPSIGVGVIVRNNDRVLIGRRKNSHGVDTWGFPGGHLEFGESVFDCAKFFKTLAGFRQATPLTPLTTTTLVGSAKFSKSLYSLYHIFKIKIIAHRV